MQWSGRSTLNNQMVLENPLLPQAPLHQRTRESLHETVWQPISVRELRETPKSPFLITK